MRQQHDEAGAAQAFAAADRLNARKADAQAAVFALSVGRQRLQQNDVAAALERLREAVRLDPGNAQAHAELSRALARHGDVEGVWHLVPEG